MKKPLVIILSIIGALLLIGLGYFVYIKVTYLNAEEIKNIVIRDTGLNSNDIYFNHVELDTEDNRYEVDFYYNNIEYEYKIDAKNGRIIYNNFKLTNSNSTNNNRNNNTNSQPNNINNLDSGISLEQAKEIALKVNNLNQSDVIFTEVKSDYENGKKIYEIEYYHNNQEYNYEIDATTGEIISYEKNHR